MPHHHHHQARIEKKQSLTSHVSHYTQTHKHRLLPSVSPQYATMATGVEAADEVGSSFSQFKLQRAPYNLRYIIYVIKDDKIQIEKEGAREKTWDDFTADLPESDCRYAVIDVEFETDDGRPTSKIVFLSWAPDTAKVRPKMVYAGSKEAIKRALVGVGIHLNATDRSELEFEQILPSLKRFT